MQRNIEMEAADRLLAADEGIRDKALQRAKEAVVAAIHSLPPGPEENIYPTAIATRELLVTAAYRPIAETSKVIGMIKVTLRGPREWRQFSQDADGGQGLKEGSFEMQQAYPSLWLMVKGFDIEDSCFSMGIRPIIAILDLLSSERYAGVGF